MDRTLISASRSGMKLGWIMALLGLVALVCGVNLYLSKPAVPVPGFLLDQQEFENYAQLYAKSYSSKAEYEYRFKVYLQNAALIRVHNSLNLDFTLSVNKFADMTQEEFSKKKIPAETFDIKNSNHAKPPVKDLKVPPMALDWRDLGVVTDVKNQRECHASWAFAGASAIESAWKISKGKLYNLSVQELIDCVQELDPCDYGNYYDAYDFAKISGLTTDVIYPYIGTNGTCNSVAISSNVTYIDSYVDGSVSGSAQLSGYVAAQPVLVPVDTDGYVWQFYAAGILNSLCGTTPDSYLVVVGYDIINNYWIAKNSWGQDWGESGYIRLGMVSGSAGICGMYSLVSYPTIN